MSHSFEETCSGSGTEKRDVFDLPTDIWSHVVGYIPRQEFYRIALISRQFHTFTNKPSMFQDYALRLKCFSPTPVTIDDNSQTISLSLQHSSFAERVISDQLAPFSFFKHWLHRLRKVRYIDFGTFPVDETIFEYSYHRRNSENNCVSTDKGTFYNELIHILLDTLIHNRSDCIDGLHFDAFYSIKIKDWFLEYALLYILPPTAHPTPNESESQSVSETIPINNSGGNDSRNHLKHLSLRWDEWNNTSLLQQQSNVLFKIFNHFWVSLDSRSHSFFLPSPTVMETKIGSRTFDHLQILTLFRMHFPNDTFHRLLRYCNRLKVLYMFGCSWYNDDNRALSVPLSFPKHLESLTVLLCDGSISLIDCAHNLTEITVDLPKNEVTKQIFEQITDLECDVHVNVPQLRRLTICSWPSVTDLKVNETVDQSSFDNLVNLVISFRIYGNATKLDTIAMNLSSKNTVAPQLSDCIRNQLHNMGYKYARMKIAEVETFWEDSSRLFNSEEADTVTEIAAKNFGLMRSQ